MRVRSREKIFVLRKIGPVEFFLLGLFLLLLFLLLFLFLFMVLFFLLFFFC